MKKLLVIIGIIAAIVSTINVKSQDLILTGPSSMFTGWGTNADSLKASQTKSFVIQTKTMDALAMSIALESDAISGTPAYTALLEKSMNNKDWVSLGDTLTVTGGASGYKHFVISTNYFNYMRVRVVATGATQKSKLYIWGNLRKTDD